MGVSSIGQHNHLCNEAQVRTGIQPLILWYRRSLLASWSLLLPISECCRETSSIIEHSNTFIYTDITNFVIPLLSLSFLVLGNDCHHHLADEGKWLKWQKCRSVCKQDERKLAIQMHFQPSSGKKLSSDQDLMVKDFSRVLILYADRSRELRRLEKPSFRVQYPPFPGAC